MSAPQAVRLVGGVVPPALISRLQAGEVSDRVSLSAGSYHLVGSETVRDAASRAWGYLRGAWTAWRDSDQARTPNTAGTGPARERWLLPLLRELGYGQVPILPSGLHVEGRDYPVSHMWSHVPIHLLGPGVDLDRRNTGVTGAARAPQAMAQELLNRTDAHLWAFLSNGLRLRLLRDSTALAGSAYVEFDLEAIFDGELYAEWLLLFQLCHVSRVEARGGPEAPPTDCWLEAWRGEAVDAGARALDRLRDGVESALTALGSGFLRHPGNGWLRASVQSGELTDRDYHRALLRLVYRLLFAFVAEDRDAFLDPAAGPLARQRYARYFSSARLRRLSRVRAGGTHPDLWQAQRLVLRAAGGAGAPAIAVPALGGLFDADPRAVVPSALRSAGNGQDSESSVPADLLDSAELANADLLTAVRSLAWVQVKGQRIQPVDYRHLGAEELGSVYESLLELIPRVDLAQQQFILERLVGNERKTTGSYYTPPALVSALLDSALDPLLDDATKNAADTADAERRLLALTICDPACGSGGFLVAAARRVARRLAQVRSGEDEPTPADIQHALRDVVGRCIYGVDLNDLAAELAKVSLWLEALEPGKPLGFLDARIRVGNSLLGTTPTLLASGVPDDAFKELEGDSDPSYAKAIRNRNAAERHGQDALPFGELRDSSWLLTERMNLLAPASDVSQARDQAQAWRKYEASRSLRHVRLPADTWCAAFVWPLVKTGPTPPTASMLRQIADNPEAPGVAETVAEVERLRKLYRFFHWHLEFPEIFGIAGRNGTPPNGATGFSCLLGNPPWNRVEMLLERYFAVSAPPIAKATNASVRMRLIQQLSVDDPSLYQQYRADARYSQCVAALLSKTGRYPLGSVGKLNTYAVFAELMHQTVDRRGRFGIILPSGLVSGFRYRRFVQRLLADHTLVSFLGFENEELIFPDITNKNKFGLLTVAGEDCHVDHADFVAYARNADHLSDPRRRYTLTPDEIRAINPNSLTVPAFRWARDAEVTALLHHAAPVLVDMNNKCSAWGVEFRQMFNMSTDSGLFILTEDILPHIISREGAAARLDDGRLLYPLYEGKMIWQFDHRYGTYEGQTQKQANKGVLPHVEDRPHDDPNYRVQPRYWVDAKHVDSSDWWSASSWSIAFRDVGPAERTLIPALVPAVASGHTTPLLASAGDPRSRAAQYALLASLVVDYDARQGGSRMTFFTVEQLAVLTPDFLDTKLTWLPGSPKDWLADRAVELSFTNVELTPFARDCGDILGPFRWSASRRAAIQAELDAGVMHLYRLDREQAEWLIDSFTVLRKNEERDHGEFRTKRLVLEFFDEIRRAMDSGLPYQTMIDPVPGHGPRHTEKGDSR